MESTRYDVLLEMSEIVTSYSWGEELRECIVQSWLAYGYRLEYLPAHKPVVWC